MRIPLLLLAVCALGLAQEVPFPKLVEYFEYDRSQPPDIQSQTIETRDGVSVDEYSFASPDAGRVPGLLIKPVDSGKHPLILYGHWMMKGSPLRNREEFREEALIMARAGAVCLLLDSPLVRGEVPEATDPMEGQGPKAQLQMAREWRRAIDLLVESGEIDPRRIAYVGHSFHAGVGAMLVGVEKRIQSFALMASQYSLREYIYDTKNPEMVADRKARGDAWIGDYFNKFPWVDAVNFVERSAPSAVFLQFGRRDNSIPQRIARIGFAHFQQPKRMAFYDAGHELDADARIDRARWLAGRLKLTTLDEIALREIPELH